jgi:hypothetical protein
MIMNKNLTFVSILVMLVVILAGCSSTPRALEGAEREAVLNYAEPMADNEFAAIDANDYEAFIKDYDEAMRTASTPKSFANLVSLISTKLGKYQTREVTAVTAVGDDVILVVYAADYENEKDVMVKLFFQPGGEHLITGLWFDSPKLRGQ